MPAAANQDFQTFTGDSVSPIFTVLSPNSTAIDISGVTDIKWSAQLNLASTATVISKTKSGGGITFTGGGTDGKFQVLIGSTDTANLSGWYIHTATLLPTSTSATTVATGRMNVGQAPDWTFNDGSIATQNIYLVRAMIGDTTQSDQLLADQAINASLGRYTTVELAAAECARFIAAKYSRQVDLVQGQLKTNYSQQAKAYWTLSKQLEQLGYSRGGASAYAGGISVTDKDNNVLNVDRITPQFLIGMFDNILPESPVGHEEGVGQAPSDVFTTDVTQG